MVDRNQFQLQSNILKRPLTQAISIRITKTGFVVKINFFTSGLQMMVGLPGDDETGVLTTAQRIADLGPDFVRIYPTFWRDPIIPPSDI